MLGILSAGSFGDQSLGLLQAICVGAVGVSLEGLLRRGKALRGGCRDFLCLRLGPMGGRGAFPDPKIALERVFAKTAERTASLM